MKLKELGDGSIFMLDGKQWRMMMKQREQWACRPHPCPLTSSEQVYDPYTWFTEDTEVDKVVQQVPLKRKRSRAKKEQDLQDPMKWRGSVK